MNSKAEGQRARSLPEVVLLDDQPVICLASSDETMLTAAPISGDYVAALRDRNSLFGSLDPLATCLVLCSLDPASRLALRLSSRGNHAVASCLDTRLVISSVEQLLHYARAAPEAPVQSCCIVVAKLSGGGPPAEDHAAPESPGITQAEPGEGILPAALVRSCPDVQAIVARPLPALCSAGAGAGADVVPEAHPPLRLYSGGARMELEEVVVVVEEGEEAERGAVPLEAVRAGLGALKAPQPGLWCDSGSPSDRSPCGTTTSAAATGQCGGCSSLSSGPHSTPVNASAAAPAPDTPKVAGASTTPAAASAPAQRSSPVGFLGDVSGPEIVSGTVSRPGPGPGPGPGQQAKRLDQRILHLACCQGQMVPPPVLPSAAGAAPAISSISAPPPAACAETVCQTKQPAVIKEIGSASVPDLAPTSTSTSTSTARITAASCISGAALPAVPQRRLVSILYPSLEILEVVFPVSRGVDAAGSKTAPRQHRAQRNPGPAPAATPEPSPLNSPPGVLVPAAGSGATSLRRSPPRGAAPTAPIAATAAAAVAVSAAETDRAGIDAGHAATVGAVCITRADGRVASAGVLAAGPTAPSDTALAAVGRPAVKPLAPPSFEFALRTMLLGGALHGLRHLRLLDLSGGNYVRGVSGGRGDGCCSRLDKATWGALAAGLPEGREVVLRLPLGLLPLPAGTSALKFDPHAGYVIAASSNHLGPAAEAPQPAGNTAAAAAAAATAAGLQGPGAHLQPPLPPPTPHVVRLRDLVPASVVRQLLVQMYDARPLVRVELTPYKNSRCNRSFMLGAPPSHDAEDDLSQLVNLQAAPVYIQPGLHHHPSSSLSQRQGQGQRQGQSQSEAGGGAYGGGGGDGDGYEGAADGGNPSGNGRMAASLRWLPASLTSLSVSGFIPDDTGLLDTLSGLIQLRELYLVGMVLGARGVAYLSQLPLLEHITVDMLTLDPAHARPQAPAPGRAQPGPADPPPVLQRLKSLVVHDVIVCSHIPGGGSGANRSSNRVPNGSAAVPSKLASMAPFLESLSFGDMSGGVESRDPTRRQRTRQANALSRRNFLQIGGLRGLSRLKRLELWDKVYASSELEGCTSLEQLTLHGLAGGRWSHEVERWAGLPPPPLPGRRLRLVGCRSSCRSRPGALLPLLPLLPMMPMPPRMNMMLPPLQHLQPPPPQQQQEQQHQRLAAALAAAAAAADPGLEQRVVLQLGPLAPAAAVAGMAAIGPPPCCAYFDGVFNCWEVTLEACDTVLVRQLLMAAVTNPKAAARLRRLRLVELSPTAAGEAAVLVLVRALPSLEELHLVRCRGLSESWAMKLSAEHVGDLRVTWMAAPSASEQGMEPRQGPRRLQR